MNKLDIKKIKTNYEKRKDIWANKDKWHYYQYLTIKSFITKNVEKLNLPLNVDVINLGSGGNPYCFREENMLHVDIIGKNIQKRPNSLVSNIEKIDVLDKSYNCCLCVGSVINYTDALVSIKEINRILKPNGYLFLEFENSKSFEFYRTQAYNKSAAIVETFYQKEIERLWVYSEKFIKNILKNYGFNIIEIERFHILSPLIYKVCYDPIRAAQFCRFDKILSYFPLVSKHASNIILVAQKSS